MSAARTKLMPVRGSGATFWGKSRNAAIDAAEWCTREMHKAISFEESNRVMALVGSRYRLDMSLDGLDHAHELALQECRTHRRDDIEALVTE